MTMSIGAFSSSNRGNSSAALPSTPIDSAAALVARGDGPCDRVLEGVRLFVEVAVLDAAGDPRLVDVDADRHAVVHGHGQRLRAAHAAEPRRQRDRAGQRAAEPLVAPPPRTSRRCLQDPLRADVDPRAGGHLPVHDQAEVVEAQNSSQFGQSPTRLEFADQHRRSPLVGPRHADRLPDFTGVDLVGPRGRAGCGQRVVRPASCAPPCPCRRRRAGPPDVRPPRRSRLLVSVRHGASVCHDSRSLGPVGVAMGPIVTAQHSDPPRRRRPAPDWTSETVASISGDRVAVGPGPSIPRDRGSSTTAAVPAAAPAGGAGQRPRTVSTSIATTRVTPSTDRRSLRQRSTPSTRGSPAWRTTGSSRRRPGRLSHFISEPITAWVYCAIMSPLSTPG